jgi:hypothetical protein
MTDFQVNQVETSRELMDKVLTDLRTLRDSLSREQAGGRELSEAITNFETGCMWMIRSQFADKPYSPLTRLKAVDMTEQGVK